jgi:hypothetical protein
MGVSGVNEKIESATLRRKGRASTIYDISESFWIYRFRCQCVNYCHIPLPGRCSTASMDRSWVTEKMLGVEGIDILVTYLARKDVCELPLLGCQINPSPHNISTFPLPGWLQQAAIGNRVSHSDLRKTLQPQQAGVALATQRTIQAGIIAAVSEAVIDSEFQSPVNDPRLDELNKGSMMVHSC